MDGDEKDLSQRKLANLHKLATKNFAKFAVSVQHVSVEAQMKIIEQLPQFRKLAEGALDSMTRAHSAMLESNDKSENQVHVAYQEWRSALISMLDQPDLTLDEKLRITAEIGQTVRGQAAKDTESKAFKKEAFAKVAFVTVGVVGVIVLALSGGKLMIDQEDSET